MKKIFYLASFATLALASCSDDFAPQNPQQVVPDAKSTIVATYPFGEVEGTRTSMESTSTGYMYKWQPGDAIGVVGSSSNQYVNNAMYVFPGPANASGIFNGQAILNNGGTYYGVYPYDPNMSFQGNNTYNISISQNQNFNNEAYELQEVDYSNMTGVRANGSFSNGEAPAVALATAENDQLNFTFQPLASYLVFPFTGVGTVNSVKLQISKATTEGGTIKQEKVPLVGSYSVNFNTVTDDGKKVNLSNLNNNDPKTTTGEFKALNTPDNDFIVLNCGKGVKLDPKALTNFWFVVPNGIKLAGATITLTVNEGSKSGEKVYKKTFSDNWMGSNGSNLTLRNDVRWLFAGTMTPFQYNGQNQNDYYLITEPWQLLEYLYAVSTPAATIVKQYYQLAGSHNTDFNYNFTDLENIVPNISRIMQSYNPSNGYWPQGVIPYEVKDAVIFGKVTVSQNAIKEFLSRVNTDGLGQYYQDVYVNYMNYGWIKQIGGASVPYTITGQNDGVNDGTISGLTIRGNGMFNSSSDPKLEQNLVNLTFDNITVDASRLTPAPKFYNFLATPDNVNFNGVIINENCKINTASPVAPNLKGVFTAVNNVNVDDFNVENNSADFSIFANTLNIVNYTARGYDEAFDFTALINCAVKNFNNIVMPVGYENEASTLVIKDVEEAVELMNMIERDGNQNYSVIDKVGKGNSYWTGTSYQKNPLGNLGGSTAEMLAWRVAYPNNTFNLEMTRNFDLMSKQRDNLTKFDPFWFASNPGGVNLSSDMFGPYTISNAYINGTQYGTKKQTEFLTLLGNVSSVKNVNFKDVTIEYAWDGSNVKPLVGILSVQPSDKVTTENVGVTGLVVNIKNTSGEKLYVGGLYSYVMSDLSNLKGITIENDFAIEGNVVPGYIAGTYNYLIMGDVDVMNPVVKLDSNYSFPFGDYYLSVYSPENFNDNYHFNLIDFEEGAIRVPQLTFHPVPTDKDKLPYNGYTLYVGYYPNGYDASKAQNVFQYNTQAGLYKYTGTYIPD